MNVKRRNLLFFLGASVGAAACGSLSKPHNLRSVGQAGQLLAMPFAAPKGLAESGLSFQPIKGPMPLRGEGIAARKSHLAYETYEVVDDLVLPAGFAYDVVAAWGDRVGNSRFGYNNDFVSFVPTGEDEGYLTVNFEYVSLRPWLESYEIVLGKSLPLEMVRAAAASGRKFDLKTLFRGDPLQATLGAIAKELLIDQGIGTISIRKTADGKWSRTYSDADRRITGISGLDDDRWLRSTGPAVAVFEKKQGQGYLDGLGSRIVGTFGNCAGGTTPWGTVLSAEENFQAQVPELVYPDGTSFAPPEKIFDLAAGDFPRPGNLLGLAGNKYGWIVEVDPANPKDWGTKHTWLGRYRHEAVGVRVVAGKPLAFYSGCDRTGGHLYKFVSRDPVRDPKAKTNSRLLEHGMLYAAQFNPDGSGHWIPLNASTPIDPTLPSTLMGRQRLQLPRRPQGGSISIHSDERALAFKQQFNTLGDLYVGNAIEQQGAILIDAHLAANAVGATPTARPEDTEIAPDGSLYIAFTSGIDSKAGSPDGRIFKGPKGEVPYEQGWVMQLLEDGNEPSAKRFSWKMVAVGGEPADGGAGFAKPDNLLIDGSGHLWLVTDLSTGEHNRAIPKRTVNATSLQGLFGNNSLWFLPTSGPQAGTAHLFGIGPMECELTGPCFSPDQQTLFLSVQHPGEIHGRRQNGATETRKFAMRSATGETFEQRRTVPLGSNWPGKGPTDPPKPAVVAIYRI